MNKKVDETTCWYDDTTCPEEMLKGARGILWAKLERADHFPVLDTLIKKALEDSVTLLDIGCGAAEVSRLFQCFYTGADLEVVINNVARVMHPQNRYVAFDIYKDDCSFIEEHDLVLMNAFIDVMQYPLDCLRKVLNNSSKYVIMHRQLVSDTTVVDTSPSYGGSTYRSIISRADLEGLLKQCGFVIDMELKLPMYQNTYSFLLRKK